MPENCTPKLYEVGSPVHVRVCEPIAAKGLDKVVAELEAKAVAVVAELVVTIVVDELPTLDKVVVELDAKVIAVVAELVVAVVEDELVKAAVKVASEPNALSVGEQRTGDSSEQFPTKVLLLSSRGSLTVPSTNRQFCSATVDLSKAAPSLVPGID